MNYSGKLNLLRFKNACIVSVQGKTEKKKGVFIPIDDNQLFVSADDRGQAKGAYVDFMAWENRQVSQYGDTHAMRQQYPREVRERMSEEQLKTIPYFGNLRPFEPRNEAQNVRPMSEIVPDVDDLPF